MWISKQSFERLLNDAAKAQGVAQTLERENTALHTTLDWMRVRVEQVERERAILIKNYTGVEVPTPAIKRVEPDHLDHMNAPVNYDDIGDDAAAKLGIGWNADGTIRYAEATS